MKAIKFLAIALASAAVTLLFNTYAMADKASKVTLISEVNWEPLNPARGDNSPKAGTLWGDRNAAVPTGFLAEFKDGFSSPPHIHNATYRAVVISGLIHNDDPDAASMWMPAGSFWTQPMGEAHITAAKGSKNIALVEIDQGPYLVRPPEQAFDNGERPINVDAANIVWVDMPAVSGHAQKPQIAYLWGDLDEGRSHGIFIKLPAGFSGSIESQGSTFHAVIIKGQVSYQQAEVKTLIPGSYFGSKGKTVHRLSADDTEAVIIYVRSNAATAVSGS